MLSYSAECACKSFQREAAENAAFICAATVDRSRSASPRCDSEEMRTVQQGGQTEINPETDIGKAVLHNLQLRSRTAEWINLDSAFKGPAHVAKFLIKKLQDDRSEPGKPYKVNAEQLECTALFVAALDKAFAKRPDASKPWLHPAEVLMTTLTDGGGGCGKTTLAVEYSAVAGGLLSSRRCS